MGQGLLERAEMKREQTDSETLPPPSPDAWNPLPPSPDYWHQKPLSPPNDPAFKGSPKDPNIKMFSKDPTSKSKEPSTWQIIVFFGICFIPYVLFTMAVTPVDKCKNPDTR